MKNTTVGVDLAKDVIKVGVYENKKVKSNTEMAHLELLMHEVWQYFALGYQPRHKGCIVQKKVAVRR